MSDIVDSTGFTECEECRMKSGSPRLCIACISNRERISTLRNTIRTQAAEIANELRIKKSLKKQLKTDRSEVYTLTADNARLREALEGAAYDLERMSRLMGEYPTSLLVAKGLLKTTIKRIG